MLEVDIKKKVDGFTLGVSFQAGIETMALLGASGSGKSMTLRCIAGIETPDEGSIVLGGRILFDKKRKINLPPRERKIGYLFQNYALFPNMTVEENIGVGIRTSKSQKVQIIKEKIKSFYLQGLEKQKPNQLSGGQQQRVALARIIASQPNIILLDEPFSALDSYLRWQLERDLIDLIESIHLPTLYVSHNRDEVYRVCHRIGVMSHGTVEVLKEKNELFRNPETLSAALLTGCKNYSNIIPIDQYHVYASDWQVQITTNTPVTEDIHYIGIRAHHINVVDKDRAHLLDNCLECMVIKIIDNTFSVIILLANVTLPDNHVSGQLRLEMNKGDWNKAVGERVWIQMEKKDILLLC